MAYGLEMIGNYLINDKINVIILIDIRRKICLNIGRVKNWLGNV